MCCMSVFLLLAIVSELDHDNKTNEYLQKADYPMIQRWLSSVPFHTKTSIEDRIRVRQGLVKHYFR